LRIPVYQEPEPQSSASSYEFMPTSTPAPEEIQIPREPQLQETAEETTRKTVADAVEPGLMTTRQQFEWEHHDHASQVEAAELEPAEATEPATVEAEPPSGHLQDIPAEIAAHAPPRIGREASEFQTSMPPPPALAVETEEPRLSEDDFEARVAAAMAAYKTAGPDAPLSGDQEPEPDVSATEAFAATPAQEQPRVAESVPAEPQQEPEIVAHQPVPEPEYKVPTFEYRPPVSAPEPVQDFEPAPAEAHAESEPVPASPEPESHPVDPRYEIHEVSAPALENAARAAAAAAGADHQAVSQAVHRVMERLKPELVEEILRELKSKE
jgi:hypothetical protein